MTRESTILIRNVAAGGRPGLDVRAGPDTIQDVGPALTRHLGERVLDGRGGALIPGLHDHHMHLHAVVAARQSADVSVAASPAEFDQIVTAAAGAIAGGAAWLRVTGWDEHASGPLDRYRLDALTGDIAVRVQHRGGAMWVLNSAALQRAGVDGCDRPGVSRDDRGAPTGRLLRLDAWLRDRVPTSSPVTFAADIRAYAAQAARRGVTGFTDATPDRNQADVNEFGRLAHAGLVPQRLMLMAPPGLATPDQQSAAAGQVTLGPMKLILDDAALPALADLVTTITNAHQAGTAVAVHCVTAEQLILTVAALEHSGMTGDRIEHAGIVPPGYAVKLARLGVAVVTQPGFITVRGDAYLRDVEPAERDWLYPCASLIRAGVTVAASTDDPFGPADPWQCVAAAVTRRTASGAVLGRTECTTAMRAISLFLKSSRDLHVLRTISPGQPADLCLLHLPLREALAKPSADVVRATIVGRRLIP
jgi:predicted amidohydrolase YtcJ